MNEDLPDLYTYRGRSLDELVTRIREDLGDDAVIVARREARTGGFAGFFARREIEVDVRPASGPASVTELPPVRSEPLPGETPAARAFREQLEAAQARVGGLDLVSDEPASAADVDVDDLFGRQPDPSSYGPAFDRRQKADQARADVIPISAAHRDAPEQPAAHAYDDDLEAVLHADLDLDREPDEPVARTEWIAPVADAPPLPEGPVELRRLTLPPQLAAVRCEPGRLGADGEAIARRAADRMRDRGLDSELADRAAAEAVAGLLPFDPGADVRELVARALGRHLPAAPLRTGAATCAVVGSGGSGKTRTVARLAAAYSHAGTLPVTVIALRPEDRGEELQRLLAPYDVELVVAGSGSEAAGATGGGMVLVDTPAIVLRDRAATDELIGDIEALPADEVHVTLPATMSADAARELLDALAPVAPAAITITHCDETFQLGPMLGLSIERELPVSYVGHGQAVDSGLTPVSPDALAAELLC